MNIEVRERFLEWGIQDISFGDFLVGLGNLSSGHNSGWFLLTNLRLIQRDGRNDRFSEVHLADVNTHEIKGMTTKTMLFKMKSGEEVTFEKVQMYPTDKFLSEMISQRTTAKSLEVISGFTTAFSNTKE